MLLKRSELEAIASGRVSLVFRRWKKPSAKTDGSLKTGLGVLAIQRVSRVDRSQLTEKDAVNAGYESLSELLGELDARDGDIYRVEVGSLGADPRIELRSDDALSASELEQIRAKLDRLDAASREGAWVLKSLQVIDRHPKVLAAVLAQKTGFERDKFKMNIRKLKNLGLTISHEVGYELSPRGRVVLESLRGDA